MKLSARLLITLVFCFLVLPFLVKHFGLGGLSQQKEIEETYEREERKITEGAASYKQQLLDSVELLDLADKNLSKCVIQNLSKYFGLSDSQGHIQDAADMTSLVCNRRDITSLDGIQAFNKLIVIDLTDNDIEDASPLGEVSTLQTINLTYGNKNIDNIDALAQLNNLKTVNFPNMKLSFCYQAERVVENMKNNADDGRVKHNFNSIDCRGKKTPVVERALRKQKQGKELSDQESEALVDYEENESWR